MYDGEGDHKVEPMVYVEVLSRNPVRFKRDGTMYSDNCVLVQRGQSDILLNHGDIVQLTNQVSVTFRTNDHLNSSPNLPIHDSVRQGELMQFSDQYSVSERLLGIGGHASVFAATKRSTQQQLACKILPFSVDSKPSPQIDLRATAHFQQMQTEQEIFARECQILRRLSHPNIVTLEKVICMEKNTYIFQELITGGDLLSYLDRRGPLAEPNAAMITRQLLEAVNYLHDNQVVHRDIKPENILMTSWRDGARIVLTDFGQSRVVDDRTNTTAESRIFRMVSIVGTHGYTAPEIYRQATKYQQGAAGYSKPVDIWSIGSITPALLTNDLIVPAEDAQRCRTITTSQYERYMDALDYDSSWANISESAKSFIRGCLATDDRKRLTAKQALAHDWLAQEEYADEFDAAYKRAIKSWTPRQLEDKLVESLDHFDVRYPPC